MTWKGMFKDEFGNRNKKILARSDAKNCGCPFKSFG